MSASISATAAEVAANEDDLTARQRRMPTRPSTGIDIAARGTTGAPPAQALEPAATVTYNHAATTPVQPTAASQPVGVLKPLAAPVASAAVGQDQEIKLLVKLGPFLSPASSLATAGQLNQSATDSGSHNPVAQIPGASLRHASGNVPGVNMSGGEVEAGPAVEDQNVEFDK